MVRSIDGVAEVPVATSNNEHEIKVSIAAIPFLPSSAVSHIGNVRFTSEDGEMLYHSAVQSVVVTPEKSVRLKTMDGAIIEWAVIDGKEMAITLEDGTEWKLCIYCTECTAANVYSTPEIPLRLPPAWMRAVTSAIQLTTQIIVVHGVDKGTLKK